MKKYADIDFIGNLNISGSLIATASYAENAVTASYSQTAVTASYSQTASFAQTGYVEYYGGFMATSQTGVGNGTDVNFVRDISKNMTYSGNTVTLKGGVTYELTAQIRTLNFSETQGYADFSLVNASTNTYIGWSSFASTFPASFTFNYDNSPSIIGIIKPTSDITIKLRCIAAFGTCTIDGGGTRLVVKAIDFN